jgi:hypothetical protein
MAIIQRMSSIPVLPLGNYANGTSVLGGATGIQVASDVTSIDISLACCTSADPTIWPDINTVLTIKPEVSTDDGVTWVEAGASVTPGGIHQSKNGGELAFVRSGGSLPAQVGAVARRYRCTVTVAGGPCRTSATVEVN